MTVEGLGDPQQILGRLVRLVKADMVEQAARLYSRLSDDVGFHLVQKLPQAGPQLSMRLAKMFFLAKEFEKAALVFEQSGEYDKAAKLYEKADDYGMAAEMYAEVENFAAAAPMFEKNGNHATAAELYQKIGDLARAAANFEKAQSNFNAGKTYFELGKHDKAVELLQKISGDDAHHIEAILIVNQVLAASGYRTIAIRKLTALLNERGLSEETLDVALGLAEQLAAEGEADQAKEWLHKLLEVRFPYKHAGDLLKRIEAGELETVALADEADVIDNAADAAPVTDEAQILDDLEPLEDSGPVMTLAVSFDAVREASLFQELSLQELKKFWTLVEPRDYNDADVVIEQGVEGQGLYIVGEGTVRVLRVDAAGKEEKLAELPAGAHLGEMTLLDDTPTSARVVALGKVRVYFMSKAAFQQLIDADDRLARRIYQAFAATLVARLRATNERFHAFKQKQQAEMADLFGIAG